MASHETLDRAARHRDALAAELPPDLAGTVDLHVGLPNTLDVGQQGRIALRTRRQQLGIAGPGHVSPVGRWGNLQCPANRLDPKAAAMLVDEGPHNLKRRSSSAWAKNALASRKISLALRSSRTSILW